MKGKKIIFFIVAFLAVSPVFSSEPGRTGAAFLNLGVGSRAVGMGEACSAAVSGVEALYWNPAELGSSADTSIMVTYNPLFDGARNNQAALAIPFNSFAMAAGYNGVAQSSIESFDEVGNQKEDFSAVDQVGVVGFSFGGKNLSAGLAAKFINSTIDDVTARGQAIDMGVSFSNPLFKSWRQALVAKNLGQKISYIDQKDPLPTSFVFGNALLVGKRLLLTFDLGQQKGLGTILAGGWEWATYRSENFGMKLRGGYTNKRNEENSTSGAALGLGFILRKLSLDYAWTSFGELGDSHAVTLVWRIPKFQ